MKTKLIPFDLEKAKNGAKIQHIDGRPARLICWDRKNEFGYHYIFLVKNNGQEETLFIQEIRLSNFQILEEVRTISAADLTGLKVGDKVWDIRKGWGKVVAFGDTPYPVVVAFDDKKVEYYTLKGFFHDTDKIQSLYRTEIKFEIPEIEI